MWFDKDGQMWVDWSYVAAKLDLQEEHLDTAERFQKACISYATTENEEDRFSFFKEICDEVENWKCNHLFLRDILQDEVMELILSAAVRYCDLGHEELGKRFILFVANSGYKDQPRVGWNGKLVSRRNTPLHDAAAYQFPGWDSVAYQLFRIYDCTEVNYANRTEMTHLHVACMAGCYNVVEKFLEKGQDVNLLDPLTGDSLLHGAVEFEEKSVAKLLLSKGADLTCTNKKGSTPLERALQKDSEKMAKLLLSNGADPNSANKEGMTPLEWALKHDKEKMAKLLLSKGADLNRTNKEGLTPLEWSLQQDNEKMVKLLLSEGTDPNRTNKEGLTPLEWALQQDNEKMAKLLLSKGADLNRTNKEGLTPLEWALQQDNEKMAKLLMSNGADLNRTNKEGLTPLEWALQQDNEKMVKLLLSEGTDPNRTNKEGLTPLERALNQGNEKMAKLLISNGADLNRTNKEGLTPLEWALQQDNEKMVKLLLSEGTDPNRTNKEGLTPLERALQQGNEKMAKLLLSNGADLNRTNKEGLTPLEWALQQDNEKMAKLLMSNGADPNWANKEGSTPLQHDNKKMAKLLLTKRADSNSAKSYKTFPVVDLKFGLKVKESQWTDDPNDLVRRYIEDNRGAQAIFTDGSKCEGAPHVGAAAYVACNDDTGREGIRISVSIDRKFTASQAECEGILVALKHCCSCSGKDFLIFSDSMKALQKLDSRKRSNGRIEEIKKLYRTYVEKNPDNFMKFVWIPGHFGIEGNAIADGIAKTATQGTPKQNQSGEGSVKRRRRKVRKRGKSTKLQPQSQDK
ncbi:unnamed protein product [Trichogramma brassicae]|uniref:RNase H type-1 domain-containing protein n=1 Tax=Trichogramma brassicae TaxID=86971 RepID=A0A6H5I1I8_9HYME|nr:unnamed protein product [Trichogramma brassicae]